MKHLIQRLIAKFDQGCASVAHLSSMSQDRSLSLRERVGLRAHFLICDYCRRYDRQLNVIRKLAADVAREEKSEQPAGPGLSRDARERIRCALESSCEPPSGTS